MRTILGSWSWPSAERYPVGRGVSLVDAEAPAGRRRAPGLRRPVFEVQTTLAEMAQDLLSLVNAVDPAHHIVCGMLVERRCHIGIGKSSVTLGDHALRVLEDVREGVMDRLWRL